MNLLFKNLWWYSSNAEGRGDIRICRGRIAGMGQGLFAKADEQPIDCSGQIALPGLINAHDHLDCNIFPLLGNPPYAGFPAWADDIYRPDEPPVCDILKVPLSDRLWVGGYKNLISGVTTVVHHGRYHQDIFNASFPVKVLYPYGWSHSLRFGKDIVKDHSNSAGMPYIIHAAEGTDENSGAEIESLKQMGLLDSNTVLVHCIALSEKQIRELGARNVKVVWCPSSNHYLYGRTAPVDRLKDRVRVSLGTDSTMSSRGFFLDELRMARSTGLVSDETLISMALDAESFHIHDGRGDIRAGGPADLVLFPSRGQAIPEALFNAGPRDLSLVLIDGEPRLADPWLAEALELGSPNVCIDGRDKWLYGPVAELKKRISRFIDPKVLCVHPVWRAMETGPFF